MSVLKWLFVFLLCLTSVVSAEEKYVFFASEYCYSHWEPTGIDGVEYETSGINALNLILDFNALTKRYSKKIGRIHLCPPIPTIRYMFTPENKAEQKKLIENTNTLQGSDALKYMLVNLPVLRFEMFENLFTINLRYEEAAFISRLTLNEDKEYRPFGETSQSLSAGQTLTQLTRFRKFSAIMESTLDLRYFDFVYGLGYYRQEYRKPYTATIDGVTIDNTIVDSEFSSSGGIIALGVQTKKNKYYYLGFRANLSLGEGKIKFSEEDNMNDYLGPYERTGLFYANLSLEYKQTFRENLGVRLYLGCDIYEYFKGVIDDNGSVNRSESFSNENDNDVDINNDVVLYLCAGFNIKF